MQFQIDLMMNWGESKEQINYPKDPHTGNIIFVVHNENYELYQINKLAIAGIKQTAEFGTLDQLMEEFDNNRNVKQYYTDVVLNCPGYRQYVINANSKFPYLSFVTMLAPSQCDFTGFHDLDLRQIRSSKTIPLYALSAGSAEDDIFITEPKKYYKWPIPIYVKDDMPFFASGQPVSPVGSIIVTRLR